MSKLPAPMRAEVEKGIVADIVLDTPRCARNPVEVARLSVELAAQLKDLAQ